jgi:hypothetical protein
MLARHDHVDVVPAAQAVIHHRKQAIGVGRQINPHDFGFFVDDVVQKTRILMREAVVILPPDVRTQ